MFPKMSVSRLKKTTDPICKVLRMSTGKSRSHRIIEWVGLERTLNIIQFQSQYCGQNCHPASQAAQAPIQPGLQGWSVHSLTGQPVSVPQHPMSKKIFPNTSPKFLLFWIKAVHPCPVVFSLCKMLVPLSLMSCLQVLEGCNELFLEPSPS